MCVCIGWQIYSQASAFFACDRERHKAGTGMHLQKPAGICFAAAVAIAACVACSQPRSLTRGMLTPARRNTTSVRTLSRNSDTAPWGGESCHGEKEPAPRFCLQVSKLPESSKIPVIAKYLPCKALVLCVTCTCPLQPACPIPGQVKLQFSRG